MNAQTRLGAFVVIAFFTLAFLSSKIGGFQWVEPEGNIFHASFSDATGISIHSPVLMAGVQVGSVTSIGLKNNQAMLSLLIQPHIQLPASTHAYIAGGGLVGEKYIALRALAGDKVMLQGYEIPVLAGGNFRDMMHSASNLTDHANTFFLKADRITHTLETILQENRQDLRSVTRQMAQMLDENRQDLRSSTHTLASILTDNEEPIHQLMLQLPATVESGRNFFDAGTLLMRDLHILMLDNRENLYRSLYQLRLASENMEQFTDDIRRNPWKLMKKKPEIKPDHRARQRRMEEMLLMTGRMGLEKELR